MNFLSPEAFLLATLIPLIILFYILRLRRKKRLVSSVYVWQRLVQDLEANTPWQRLQSNILLILQLLIISVLIFSLARPFNWVIGFGGRAAIIIIDTSASMAANDVIPNRLEIAKQEAHDYLDRLPETTRVAIISAGAEPRILVPWTSDRRKLHNSIEKISVSMGANKFDLALELAKAISTLQPDNEIFVITDGGFAPGDFSSPSGSVRFTVVGDSAENQAINLFTLTVSPEGDQSTAVIQVANYGDSHVNRQLALYTEGELFNVYELSISAGGDTTVIEDNIPGVPQSAVAQLLPSEVVQDHLILDDRAVAIQREKILSRLTLISHGNLFLETALGLFPGTDVSTIEPTNEFEITDADLTIIDSQITLTGTLPAGNLLFIAPAQSNEYFNVQGLIQTPTPKPFDPSDPLLTHVTLDQVNILDAVRISLPDWARPVVIAYPQGEDEDIPLIFVGQKDSRRIAVVTFDLHHSDLPLTVDFPILFSNLMGWLLPGGSEGIPTQVLPDEAISFPIPSPVIDPSSDLPVKVTYPDGTLSSIIMKGTNFTFADTQQLGQYLVDFGEGLNITFSVNFFIPQESETRPNFSHPFIENQANQASTLTQTPNEWWRIFALIAIFLLLLEWMVYHRSKLAYLTRKTTAYFKRLSLN